MLAVILCCRCNRRPDLLDFRKWDVSLCIFRAILAGCQAVSFFKDAIEG